MQINTTLGLGDLCFFMQNDRVAERTVHAIKIFVDREFHYESPKVRVIYTVSANRYDNGSEGWIDLESGIVFPTKAELLATL